MSNGRQAYTVLAPLLQERDLARNLNSKKNKKHIPSIVTFHQLNNSVVTDFFNHQCENCHLLGNSFVVVSMMSLIRFPACEGSLQYCLGHLWLRYTRPEDGCFPKNPSTLPRWSSEEAQKFVLLPCCHSANDNTFLCTLEACCVFQVSGYAMRAIRAGEWIS